MAESTLSLNKDKKLKPGRFRLFFRRRRKLFIFIAVILAVIIILLLFNNKKNTNNNSNLPRTLLLTRMDLNQLINGTGTLQSSATYNVYSILSYPITNIYVHEGDSVSEGQILALLDTSQIEDNIAEVVKNINDAEAQDALSLSQAERRLQDAIKQYSIDEERLNKEVDKAGSKLKDANAAKKNAADEAAKKKIILDQANDSLTDYPADGDPEEIEALQKAVAEAKIGYDAAVTVYDAKKSAAEQVQTSYDLSVQQRDATLRQNSISIENARDAVNNQKLKDSAASFRVQLISYEDNLENCKITSPASGTITESSAKIGNSAGGTGISSSLFVIEDTDNLIVSSRIPEYDAINIKPGMPVIITSDAVDKEEWLGNVKSISPKATDESSNFTVIVELTPPVGRLTIGMSVKLNIVTDSNKNVFAVPYDTVTINPQGQSIVYALSEPINIIDDSDTDNEYYTQQHFSLLGGFSSQFNGSGDNTQSLELIGRPIIVETGMETDYYIEIFASELMEGMILLADPEDKSTVLSDGGITSSGGFPIRRVGF